MIRTFQMGENIHGYLNFQGLIGDGGKHAVAVFSHNLNCNCYKPISRQTVKNRQSSLDIAGRKYLLTDFDIKENTITLDQAEEI